MSELSRALYTGHPSGILEPSAHSCASGRRATITNRAERQYRSRVEILRDFLVAVRATEKKTRVIGLANLNPTSYRPYLEFCLAHRLVRHAGQGYRLTPRAESVLDAIDRLVSRSAEVDAALLELQRGLDVAGPSAPAPNQALRYVSLVAFGGVPRSGAEPLASVADSLESTRPLAVSSDRGPAWSERVVALGLQSPALAGAALAASSPPPKALVEDRADGRSRREPQPPRQVRGSPK